VGFRTISGDSAHLRVGASGVTKHVLMPLPCSDWHSAGSLCVQHDCLGMVLDHTCRRYFAANTFTFAPLQVAHPLPLATAYK
jgi:hypothetical protein